MKLNFAIFLIGCITFGGASTDARGGHSLRKLEKKEASSEGQMRQLAKSKPEKIGGKKKPTAQELLIAELQSKVTQLTATVDELTATVDSLQPVTPTPFGETDHYLAATLDTVTWGYFDGTATPKVSMASGETITIEVITHHSSHDYAKMIRGDKAVEEIFYWAKNTSLTQKPEPKYIGTGVHLVTGPVEVIGAMPGDILQVDILELEPRYNPATGKTYGTNSQKFAGYHYNSKTGFARDGTPYVRTGGTEAITVFEFIEDETSKMLYGKPVYMYRYPNMTAPDGSKRTFDNNPAVMIPHEFNMGYNGELLETEPIFYPEGFDGFTVSDFVAYCFSIPTLNFIPGVKARTSYFSRPLLNHLLPFLLLLDYYYL
jgi:Acetamidase/Formamidase family